MIKELKATVEDILEKFPATRDDDKMLIGWYGRRN